VVREVKIYLERMAEIRATGGATDETSYYGALENLLNAVGKELKPRVICNGQIRNQGAGHPDFGLYTESQCSSTSPKEGQGLTPERGVVEVKSLADETWKITKTAQVSKYWDRYRLVLVTNYRDFLIVGVDSFGKAVRLESFALAQSDTAFWQACARSQRTAQEIGVQLVEYLKRALTQLAPLSRPADLAWILASYARDALTRIERHATLSALAKVRSGLEEALGLKFEARRGEHFFRSTLIQTLLYGVFSSWVQWCKDISPGSSERFDWHAAGWSLHVPMITNLFEQVATPSRLGPLGLVEVLNWTGDALNRVDRAEFFAAFDQGHAVQYFYEPFLAAFDPELRKQLGVWYTPPEVVRYMVERVDRVLQDTLGIADGVASPNVYILDPCCGTGSFIVEVLNVIADRLHQQGGDALIAQDLKEAAMKRVFGFEIMPAPFVIAHWQVGLRLADAGAPLASGMERAAIYLSNALTGWQPPRGPKQQLIFPELEEERDAADYVKREVPILVIIGNPPYNAFAGTSPVEEEGLVEPYKAGLQKVWGIRKFNLDELYVRFLRVAERRIVEQTGRGIVCFISSYSYLSDASFVVVRRHLLEGFDAVWIDSLNGDSRETAKLTPEGKPDPSIFSTEFNREGIKLGTAVGIFAKSRINAQARSTFVRYREFWGTQKREELLSSLKDPDFDGRYATVTPKQANRYPFRPSLAAGTYGSWPNLIELAADEPFSGLSEKRKGALISTDRQSLAQRMRHYLDPDLSFSSVKAAGAGPIEPAGRFDPKAARSRLLAEEPFDETRIRRYAMYPLDQRWCYYTEVRPTWNEPRPALAAQTRDHNVLIVSRMAARRPDEGLPMTATTALANHHLVDPNAHAFPARVWPRTRHRDLFRDEAPSKANLSSMARAGWARIPLPSSEAMLSASAALGARLAALLDPDVSVTGITSGALKPPFRAFAAMTHVDGKRIKPAELAVTAGWGHGGAGAPVMPSRGRIAERVTYCADELAEIESVAKTSGESIDNLIKRLGSPVDVYLNEVAYWRAVPRTVWEFSIGGYQVFKKWLSYREQSVLGRPLTLAEAHDATAVVRRLAAVVLMHPDLDTNYERIRDAAYIWNRPQR
jgi:hypothetical protein